MNKTIEIVSLRHVRGPNLWTYWPVLEAIVDIHDLEDFPSNLIEGLPERLVAWVPTLIEHRCSIGERGGFVQRLHEGTWPGHIMEHLGLELLGLAGVPAGFGRARETSKRGVYKVVIGSAPPAVAEAALLEARDLLMAAIEDRPFDVAAAVERVRALADRHCLGPSTACIVDAAVARGIPAMRLNEGNLVQLGQGASQRRIWTAETDRTSAIAETISRDKDLSKRLLAACGVPVPEGELVDDVARAWEAARSVGLPVVVKPVDGNHGRGVFTCLDRREEIEAAWRIAAEEGSGVIIERFVPGNEHRLLVVGGRVVAAARGEPASVVGDGRSTVLELIAAQLNSDPRRGTSENHPLNPVGIDSPARAELARQGLTPESVPEAGREVLIQRNGNVAFDVTDQVHPEVARVAGLAARVIGLDIAGIDLVATDIGRPLAEQGGAIVEVNAGPGLLMHLRPAEGKPRPVGEAIVEHLFGRGSDGRIPVVGITGTCETSRVARLVAWLMQLQGRRVGLACEDGLFIGDRHLAHPAPASYDAGHLLLVNPTVEAAVFTHRAADILADGLPYDRCQVGLVTDVTVEPALARFDVTTPAQAWRVVRTQVDVVLASGAAVLNADDPAVLEMAELCDGEVILYGSDPGTGPIAGHCRDGGQAVHFRDGRLVLAGGDRVVTLLEPSTLARCARRGVDAASAMAVAACAVALGIPPEVMRTGFDTFDADRETDSPDDRGARPYLSVATSAR